MIRQQFFAVIASTGLLFACSGDEDGNSAVSSAGTEVNSAKQFKTVESNDPITALCVDHREQLNVCECASMKFRAENEHTDVYAALSDYYLTKTNKDHSIADRWQEAVDVVLADYSVKSTEMERSTQKLQLSNALGRAHREAIKACSGQDAG